MTYSAQLAIPEPEFRWAKPDGTLDMDALLRESVTRKMFGMGAEKP
jgi:hypothetical protein